MFYSAPARVFVYQYMIRTWDILFIFRRIQAVASKKKLSKEKEDENNNNNNNNNIRSDCSRKKTFLFEPVAASRRKYIHIITKLIQDFGWFAAVNCVLPNNNEKMKHADRAHNIFRWPMLFTDHYLICDFFSFRFIETITIHQIAWTMKAIRRSFEICMIYLCLYQDAKATHRMKMVVNGHTGREQSECTPVN